MGTLHQFDYIFATGTIFTFLDAWNIGANDVANSFASSISTRSLKYWAPVIAGAFLSIIFLAFKFTVFGLKTFDRSLKKALLLIPILMCGCLGVWVFYFQPRQRYGTSIFEETNSRFKETYTFW
ncbi:Piso0_001203 [Millerozyma farinosa CBS 7064]|uniref:Piso0_001203 protein n=1 Tax=Pichia sorbitophila (strain ATCC MYA-4447 / BCRC 22081 / CBS 7064 / NBRC 10061 / NRRL Y-12695) TaxID=559304 RepID=G8YSN9_PICSO|nr:Piso0_001203 [Millerozyma farinosa CBS 7064]CCE79162.1 Piso0_001203 [Millerozyma farinosa CBS 7064]